MKRFIVLVTALLVTKLAYGDLFGPSNYDECITESMKGVTSDLAARAIIQSCREQFPTEKQKNEAAAHGLTNEELRKITREARLLRDWFTVTFHNGNQNLTITEVTITLGSKSEPDESRKYKKNVSIAPFGTGEAIYTIIYSGKPANISWSISAAKGY